MKDVYYHPKDLKQGDLLELVDHVKSDRSPEDLLTQLMLDLGLTLDLPMESMERGEQTIYTVGGNSLVACLDTAITMDIVDEIANMQPLRAVFRDSAFTSEDDRINLDTHFKRLSPETKITVI